MTSGMMASVAINSQHYEITEHDPGMKVFDSEYCAESVWTHPGFQGDCCIRISCSGCGAQATLDIGDMEYMCTDRQSEPTPPWCPEYLGEIGPS
jgi:hypothetical protein